MGLVAFVQYAGTEQLASIMVPLVVMDAKVSSDAAYERAMFTAAGKSNVTAKDFLFLCVMLTYFYSIFPPNPERSTW